MPFDHAEFTRDVREIVAQVPEQRADVEEATPEQSREMCLREIQRACEADSLDHMVMHLESAVIWARGAHSLGHDETPLADPKVSEGRSRPR